MNDKNLKLKSFKMNKIILENKHILLSISKVELGYFIIIKNKKTNQNRTYYYNNMEKNNVAKKYLNIIENYIVLLELGCGNDEYS